MTKDEAKEFLLEEFKKHEGTWFHMKKVKEAILLLIKEQPLNKGDCNE